MGEARVRADRFILLYALAWAGGTIAYVPLLSILLPVQVTGLASKSVGVDWLAYIALVGAIAASLGSILFGYLSDITGNRRLWVACGLVLSCAMLITVGRMTSLSGLLAAIIVWQLALNMMLGPLAAWAGDVVPDNCKGMLGGLMAFAPSLGALSGAFVTLPGMADVQQRPVLVAALVAICVLPVLLTATPDSGQGPVLDMRSGEEPADRRMVALRMWLARLAVQVAEATLFAYLFFWMTSLDPRVTDNQSASLFSVTMVVSAPLALLAGRWSDRTGRPILPLQVCALISALALCCMAIAPGLLAAKLAYGLFGVFSAIFLALHSAQTLRILPRADRRGRDLGLFNLSNTVPSLVMPWMAMAIIPRAGFPALFLILALLSALGALLLSKVTPDG